FAIGLLHDLITEIATFLTSFAQASSLIPCRTSGRLPGQTAVATGSAVSAVSEAVEVGAGTPAAMAKTAAMARTYAFEQQVPQDPAVHSYRSSNQPSRSLSQRDGPTASILRSTSRRSRTPWYKRRQMGRTSIVQSTS